MQPASEAKVRELIDAVENMRTGFAAGRRWADESVQRERVRWMLGMVAAVIVVSTLYVGQALKDVSRELRILQVHVQDASAVLIREGIANSGDFVAGPVANSNDDQEENDE